MYHSICFSFMKIDFCSSKIGLNILKNIKAISNIDSIEEYDLKRHTYIRNK